jgi:hypothetical protein
VFPKSRARTSPIGRVEQSETHHPAFPKSRARTSPIGRVEQGETRHPTFQRLGGIFLNGVSTVGNAFGKVSGKSRL